MSGIIKVKVNSCAKSRGNPGIEPGTSRTLSENHATRPITLDRRYTDKISLKAFSIGGTPLNWNYTFHMS